jgi:hypothetical protein
VNYAVAHSLHRHSESLVNAFERVALRVVQEIIKYEHSPTGPTLGSHKGELPFQTRPPLPYTLAAAESHGSSAYVVYKVGGDPMDHQFFSEPPKEIPHGYVCAYIPDSSIPVHSAQKAAGGVSGADVWQNRLNYSGSSALVLSVKTRRRAATGNTRSREASGTAGGPRSLGQRPSDLARALAESR